MHRFLFKTLCLPSTYMSPFNNNYKKHYSTEFDSDSHNKLQSSNNNEI